MTQVVQIGAWRYPANSPRLDSAPGSVSPYSQWSYRLGPARARLRCDHSHAGASLRAGDGLTKTWSDPLEALAWLETNLGSSEPSAGPPFRGGWFGFFAYELGKLFEDFPRTPPPENNLPLFDLSFHDSIDARGPDGIIHAIDNLDSRWGGRFDQPVMSRPSPATPPDSRASSNFTPATYCKAVEAAIDYIRAGDIFQVNLSQRFTVDLAGRDPAGIYHQLSTRFPSWYGAFIPAGDYALLSNSPELFLRVEPTAQGRRVTTRPIKGTRPRGPDMETALRNSSKDQAELNMIVDLERNDLGRICRTGTVRVIEPRVIEAHPTVFHGAATIQGILRPQISIVDLLRATFPGGSVTGAPKIRAMQIIDELETTHRGPYCGAIGYIGIGGHIQLNVAIRTMIIQARRIHIPVGGGIVADSEPEAEYQETLLKARAMFDVLGINA